MSWGIKGFTTRAASRASSMIICGRRRRTTSPTSQTRRPSPGGRLCRRRSSPTRRATTDTAPAPSTARAKVVSERADFLFCFFRLLLRRREIERMTRPRLPYLCIMISRSRPFDVCRQHYAHGLHRGSSVPTEELLERTLAFCVDSEF